MRFFGEVGYANSVETSPGSGVWEDVITESMYTGDVVRDARKLESGEGLNNDISVRNSVSVVADRNLIDNFMKIRYVRWMGTRWTVSEVEVRSPRLILSLGSVYNGPTP